MSLLHLYSIFLLTIPFLRQHLRGFFSTGLAFAPLPFQSSVLYVGWTVYFF